MIKEKLAALLGCHPAILPDNDPKKTWQRHDCVFCGGDRAVVNYDLGWYRCYRCMDNPVTIIEDENQLIIKRFERTINRAVSYTIWRYGNWMRGEEDHLLSCAEWLVWNYASGRESRNDGGMLGKWETEFPEEPWRVEGMVYFALRHDLKTEAKKIRRWKSRTHSDQSGDMLDQPETEPVERKTIEGGRSRRARTYAAHTPRRKHFESQPPKGADLDHRAPLDLGELERCELMRNGAGPRPGHCKWCNRVIADAVVDKASLTPPRTLTETDMVEIGQLADDNWQPDPDISASDLGLAA